MIRARETSENRQPPIHKAQPDEGGAPTWTELLIRIDRLERLRAAADRGPHGFN